MFERNITYIFIVILSVCISGCTKDYVSLNNTPFIPKPQDIIIDCVVTNENGSEKVTFHDSDKVIFKFTFHNTTDYLMGLLGNRKLTYIAVYDMLGRNIANSNSTIQSVDDAIVLEPNDNKSLLYVWQIPENTQAGVYFYFSEITYCFFDTNDTNKLDTCKWEGDTVQFRRKIIIN